jgi:hypothetical protein
MGDWVLSNQHAEADQMVAAPPRNGRRSATDGGVLRRCSPVIECGDGTGYHRAYQAHEEEEELTRSM